MDVVADGLLVDDVCQSVTNDDADTVDIKDNLSYLEEPIGVEEILDSLNQVVSFVKERFGGDLQCLLLYDAFRSPFLSVMISFERLNQQEDIQEPILQKIYW